jgi:hypothetical protein
MTLFIYAPHFGFDMWACFKSGLVLFILIVLGYGDSAPDWFVQFQRDSDSLLETTFQKVLNISTTFQYILTSGTK